MNPKYTETHEILRQLWPHLFTVPVPLKIGIHKDIRSAVDGQLTQSKICRFLYHWVHEEGYQRQLATCKARYGLDGSMHPKFAEGYGE